MSADRVKPASVGVTVFGTVYVPINPRRNAPVVKLTMEDVEIEEEKLPFPLLEPVAAPVVVTPDTS